MKTFTLITTAFFLSGSIFSLVQAAAPSDVPTVVVKFGELDMTRAAAKTELYRRLNRAAQAVCSAGSSQKGIVTAQHEACINQALSNAVAQINQTDFTKYVATQNPKLLGVVTRLAAR